MRDREHYREWDQDQNSKPDRNRNLERDWGQKKSKVGLQSESRIKEIDNKSKFTLFDRKFRMKPMVVQREPSRLAVC
ncbi:hypothetical protein EVAR_74403_1 [Eumeta japonica]|uniref:Uncharacterized protein n=1 Tax=Eumeta variegata TaxID=151549 RepID=A0A4C1SD67_EUMVA|nr:hypothetical protein EVAR_74403_1 [Eumeta japonica]